MTANPLDPAASSGTPIDARRVRRPHPPVAGKDENIPGPLIFNPPTRDVIDACTAEQITRVRAWRADPDVNLGAHTPHLCFVQGGPPLTIYGYLEGVEVAKVYTCAHGNMPDLHHDDGTLSYCWECGLYLPTDRQHFAPATIARLPW